MLVKMIQLDCYSVKSTTFYNTQAITDCKVITSCSLSLSSHHCGFPTATFFFFKETRFTKSGADKHRMNTFCLCGVSKGQSRRSDTSSCSGKVVGAGLTWEDGRICRGATDSGHNLSKHGAPRWLRSCSGIFSDEGQNTTGLTIAASRLPAEIPSLARQDLNRMSFVVWSPIQFLQNGLKPLSDVSLCEQLQACWFLTVSDVNISQTREPQSHSDSGLQCNRADRKSRKQIGSFPPAAWTHPSVLVTAKSLQLLVTLDDLFLHDTLNSSASADMTVHVSLIPHSDEADRVEMILLTV